MKPSRWWIHGEWAGLIAFVLALGVSVSLVLDIVLVTMRGDQLTGPNANLLSTLFGAVIGVVGTYIGAHGRHGRRAQDERKPEDDGQLRRLD